MDPVLFNLWGFPVAWYGFFVVVAAVTGLWTAQWLGKRAGFHPGLFIDLLVICTLGLFLGARGLYILTVFPDFLKAPLDYVFTRAGFVFLGGLIGSLGIASWFTIKNRLPYWKLADICVPGIALGHAFGRIGCHMTGCCHGGVCSTDAWYGLTVPLTAQPSGDSMHVLGGYAVIDQIEAGLLPPGAVMSLPVYPVQLLEAGFLFGLAGFLAYLTWRDGRKQEGAGRVLGIYLIVYAIARFALEFLRGDSGRGLVSLGPLTLSTSQLLSIAMLGIGVWIYRQASHDALPGKLRDIPPEFQWPPSVEIPAVEPKPAKVPNRADRRRSGA